MAERVLITGALGCVGAWAVKAVLDEGDEPVGYDLGDAMHRLELVLSPEELEQLTLVRGDITDLDALGRALDEHAITRVVHLAALQVPFCRADPVLGARVNVVGTVNVFEAVRQRLDRIPGLAYASSAAVYGRSDPSPAPESGGGAPETLYGVFKLANEGTARLYWDDWGVPSIGIRPYTVYGPGRDQGLTSGPTQAMVAAARGEGMGAKLPLNLIFIDADGRTARLGDSFGERPVILHLVYYECPMLCKLSSDGLLSALSTLSLKPGQDFSIVTVSFDPHKGPELSARAA